MKPLRPLTTMKLPSSCAVNLIQWPVGPVVVHVGDEVVGGVFRPLPARGVQLPQIQAGLRVHRLERRGIAALGGAVVHDGHARLEGRVYRRCVAVVVAVMRDRDTRTPRRADSAGIRALAACCR